MTATTTYHFKVAAINSVGKSTFSDAIALVTTALTVPDPPTTLIETVASKTSTSVTFSWTAPVNDGGSAITGYEIWSDEGGKLA